VTCDGAWTAIKSVEHEKPPDERLRLIHVLGLAMPLSVAETGMPFATRCNLAEIIQLLETSIFPNQRERLDIDSEPRDLGRRAPLFIAQGY
jgi:hypothetical protein